MTLFYGSSLLYQHRYMLQLTVIVLAEQQTRVKIDVSVSA